MQLKLDLLRCFEHKNIQSLKNLMRNVNGKGKG
jgi:hypothetical protein